LVGLVGISDLIPVVPGLHPHSMADIKKSVPVAFSYHSRSSMSETRNKPSRRAIAAGVPTSLGNAGTGSPRTNSAT
jgi:hypothetical protein